jgi:diguanylate cyclase (GGDEF)-like protein
MMMGMDTRVMPSQEHLLAVIELQNAIAAAGMNAEEVMRIVADRAESLTGGTGGLVALAEGDDLVFRAVSGGSKARAGMRVGKQSTLAGRCVNDRRVVRIADSSADASVDADTRARASGGSIVCVPLMYGEHAVGALEVTGPKFGDGDVETLGLLAQIVAIALHRVTTYPRPRYDNQHDALTGLENRRAFDERISTELGRNKRYGHAFSLALLDLGGLEVASDRFGQAAMDAILREVAVILKKHTRVIDACFRLGGDEFAIVMPGTQLAGAKILAERFDGHINDAKLAEGTVTGSLGVVEAADEGPEALIERARASMLAK